MESELPISAFPGRRLSIKQPPSGYRFSIDAVLIASKTQLRPGDRVLDIGTGCGIISLLLAYRYPDIKIFGIDIQQELLDIALQNVSDNHMQHRIILFNCDAKNLTLSHTLGPVDVVVCNPPHQQSNSGRINPSPQLAIARHEIAMTIDNVMGATERMLKNKGRFIVIYPASRLADILEKMRAVKIEPKRLCLIYSKSHTNAIRCLIEGAKGGKPGMTATPPLILSNDNGSYTETLKNIISSYPGDYLPE